MMPDDRKLLILSDGKPGHVNQSIAFAKHLGLDFELCEVTFRHPFFKALSYLLDRCHLKAFWLFEQEPFLSPFRAVVSAGSNTYYANRVLAKKLGIPSVAIMLPRGYCLDFDLIVAQNHDKPPQRSNIIQVPINLSWLEPQGLVKPEDDKRYISLVVGGDGTQGKLDAVLLQRQVNNIFSLFPDHGIWLTTSRRTSAGIEAMLRKYSFDRAFFYSDEPINPIPDFLKHSEYVFITADSSSMISEAVSFGHSCVEILLLSDNKRVIGKFGFLLCELENLGCLHLFDGEIGKAQKKIDLGRFFRGVGL